MKGTILKLTNRNAVQKFFELAKNKVVQYFTCSLFITYKRNT